MYKRKFCIFYKLSYYILLYCVYIITLDIKYTISAPLTEELFSHILNVNEYCSYVVMIEVENSNIRDSMENIMSMDKWNDLEKTPVILILFEE